MAQEPCQNLDEIEERIFELRDIDDTLCKELGAKICNLSTQIVVQRGFVEIVRLVRQGKPLPVRRINFNIKKLSESNERADSRWSRLQNLDFQTLVFCALSFAGLVSMRLNNLVGSWRMCSTTYKPSVFLGNGLQRIR